MGAEVRKKKTKCPVVDISFKVCVAKEDAVAATNVWTNWFYADDVPAMMLLGGPKLSNPRECPKTYLETLYPEASDGR